MKAKKRLLFFINGTVPSEEEWEAAELLEKEQGFQVSFRNIRFFSEDASIESCEGVAGEVPKNYKRKYKSLWTKKATWKREGEK